MKKLFFLILFGSLSSASFSQVSPWFTAKEIEPGVWVIDEQGAVNMYLVIGRDSAMLVDTGLGIAGLKQFVQGITDKPLIVINTHGHPDHSGANNQFDKIWVNPLDKDAAIMFAGVEARKNAASMMLGEKKPSPSDLYQSADHSPQYLDLKAGKVFDLGDRQLEVMALPGHSPGSVGFLDAKNRILVAGDNNNLLVWLFLETCTPLSVYLQTLEMQGKRIPEFDTILPGHGGPIPASFISDQIACVKAVLDGTASPRPYDSFAGKAMINTYGKASVAYNPNRLRP